MSSNPSNPNLSHTSNSRCGSCTTLTHAPPLLLPRSTQLPSSASGFGGGGGGQFSMSEFPPDALPSSSNSGASAGGGAGGGAEEAASGGPAARPEDVDQATLAKRLADKVGMGLGLGVEGRRLGRVVGTVPAGGLSVLFNAGFANPYPYP